MADSNKNFIEKYYEWIAEVCKVLGKPIEYGEKLAIDVNWFTCWDDGMSPEGAVNEARSKGVIE
jgi:hypothetical protein